MGCSCKNKVKEFEKYAVNLDTIEKKNNFVLRFTQSVVQFLFGIIVGILILIVMIPIILYIIGCLLIGKEATIKTKYFTRWLHK